MAHHEFQMPARVDEVRPSQRVDVITPEVAPAAPVATDDGSPLGAPAPTAPAPLTH
jgi:hypothetical protein